MMSSSPQCGSDESKRVVASTFGVMTLRQFLIVTPTESTFAAISPFPSFHISRPISAIVARQAGLKDIAQAKRITASLPHGDAPALPQTAVRSDLWLTVGQYNYPPKAASPGPCFYNPSGYACCNISLNDLMTETYLTMAEDLSFNKCNIGAVASKVQKVTEERFKKKFETIVGLDDFAQKISFTDNLVCKIEVDGRFILTYAALQDVSKTKRTG